MKEKHDSHYYSRGKNVSKPSAEAQGFVLKIYIYNSDREWFPPVKQSAAIKVLLSPSEECQSQNTCEKKAPQ